MSRRTMVLQDQIRSTTSGIEYIDTLDLAQAETIVEDSPTGDPVTSGTLIADMNFLRTAVRDIKGSPIEVNWFDQAVDNPAYTTLSGARGSLNSIQTYIGAADDFDTTPDYDTQGGPAPVYINQGDPVNVAIEKLDEALVAVSGSQAGEIAKQRHVRSGGNVAKNTTLDLSDLVAGSAGWDSEGDTITWTDATDFVENVSVFHNGVLMLPGADANADNDVYFVGSPDQLAFEFRLKKRDVIQIWMFPPSA